MYYAIHDNDATTTAAEVRRAGITADDIIAAVLQDDCLGFCTACGAEADGVEPDARGYECESCGERRVFGAEELLFLEAYGSGGI